VARRQLGSKEALFSLSCDCEKRKKRPLCIPESTERKVMIFDFQLGATRLNICCGAHVQQLFWKQHVGSACFFHFGSHLLERCLCTFKAPFLRPSSLVTRGSVLYSLCFAPFPGDFHDSARHQAAALLFEPRETGKKYYFIRLVLWMIYVE
jgi:hypothetical protein